MTRFFGTTKTGFAPLIGRERHEGRPAVLGKSSCEHDCLKGEARWWNISSLVRTAESPTEQKRITWATAMSVNSDVIAVRRP